VTFYVTLWTKKCLWILVLAQRRRLLLFEIGVFSEQFVAGLVEAFLKIFLKVLLRWADLSVICKDVSRRRQYRCPKRFLGHHDRT
jgi:hypothetical protein